MAYSIIGYDGSAEGYANKGVRNLTFCISALADLAEDSEILNAPAGSSWMLATTRVLGTMNPLNSHWVLPTTAPTLITTQPSDISTQTGHITGSLTVACYAQDSTGVFTPTYAWNSNNSKDYTSPTPVAGATSATYEIPANTAEGTYYYFCIITSNSVALNSAIATVVVAADGV